tara:strand:- start:2440 stop:2802 length:363 start_codon:yes stop_codon:yes gene_type:complete
MKQVFDFIKKNESTICLFLAVLIILCLINDIFFNRQVLESMGGMRSLSKLLDKDMENNGEGVKKIKEIINNELGPKYNNHTHDIDHTHEGGGMGGVGGIKELKQSGQIKQNEHLLPVTTP